MSEAESPRLHGPAQVPMPPPIEPTPGAASHKLAQVTTGKKKKWGLSSVFGGGDKSLTSLAPVDELGYTGSTSSLKRTQSGSKPADRAPAVVTDDPKKAKKEAERAAREAEKVKREVADRQQRERARAVLQKRNALIEERRLTNTKSEIEFGGTFNDLPEAPPPAPVPQPVMSSAASLHQTQARDFRSYPNMPGSVSTQSIRSQDSYLSGHSAHSEHSQSQPVLSVAALEHQGKIYDAAGRRKARRRDEDDDHSMSSFDRNSLRSRSVLTIGTVDSE